MFSKTLFATAAIALVSIASAQTITQVAYMTNRQYSGVQVNDSGTVIGNYTTSTSTFPRGWAWSAGSFIAVNLPAGYPNGSVSAINSAGKISGNSYSAVNDPYPTFWNLSGGSYSGTIASVTKIEVATRAINSAGEAVGKQGSIAYMFIPLPTPNTFSIPPWPGNTSAGVYDINDSSTVLASSSGGTGGVHRYIAQKGGSTPYYTTRTQIPNSFSGYTTHTLSAMNNLGVVVGWGQDFLSNSYGFTWTAGSGFTLLTAPPTGGDMQPIDINDNDDIVGAYNAPAGRRPFAILGGVFYDLSSYFTGVPNLEVNEAVSINMSRQIVVNGSISIVSGGSVASNRVVYLLDLP